jgi:hypothetical protein
MSDKVDTTPATQSNSISPRDDSHTLATGAATAVAIPSWLVSLATHAVILTLGAALMQVVPRMPPGDDGGRAGGIALASTGDAGTQYFSDADSARNGASATSATQVAPNLSLPLPGLAQQPSVSGANLPTKLQSMGLPGEGTSGKASAGGGGNGSGELTTGKGKGGWGKGVQTGIFGAQGTGSTFVYVFDRSESMTGPPLAAAKKELIQSLDHLGTGHQFQIVFYNQAPTIFLPRGGQTSSLVFADKQNKTQAAEFTKNILAAGATRHMEALKAALGLRPDVIFFLTDAADPQLSESELEEIRRLNRGASINCVEFGTGISPGGDNFLRRLARQNDGEHVYVNVNELGR